MRSLVELNLKTYNGLRPSSKLYCGTVLELPPGMTMASDTLNYTRHWYLEMGTWPQKLEYYPRILSATTSSDGGSDNNPSAEWLDGRLYGNTADFQSLSGGGVGTNYCGTMYGNVTALLIQDDMTLAATQYSSAYVQSTANSFAQQFQGDLQFAFGNNYIGFFRSVTSKNA